MATGRERPTPSGAALRFGTAVNEHVRTTSYPQGQEGKAPAVGEKRTTSYRNSIQYNDRGYATIN